MKKEKTMILTSNIKINKEKTWKAVEEEAITASSNEEIQKKWTKTKKRQKNLRIILAVIFIIAYIVYCTFSRNSGGMSAGLSGVALVCIYYLVSGVFNKPVNKYAWFRNFIKESQKNVTQLFHEKKKAIYEQVLIEIFGEVKDTSFGKMKKSYGFLLVTSEVNPVNTSEHGFANQYTFKRRFFPSYQDMSFIKLFTDYDWKLTFQPRDSYWTDENSRVLHIYIKSCFLNEENCVCVTLEGDELDWNFTSFKVNNIDFSCLETNGSYGWYNLKGINDHDSLIKNLHDDSGWPY
jgi:hypothetical protein